MDTDISALFSLPVDIFDAILHETVLTVGVFEAVQLRLVSRLFDAAIQRTLFSMRVFEGGRWPQRYGRVGHMSPVMLSRLILHKTHNSHRSRTSPLGASILGALQFARECPAISPPMNDQDEDRLGGALADIAANVLGFTCATRNLAAGPATGTCSVPGTPSSPHGSAAGMEADLGLGGLAHARQVALMGAVALGDERLIAQLVADGADVNRQAMLFGMPLALAAQRGNLEIFRLLLQLGARRDGVCTSNLVDDRPALAWFAARCRPPLETAVQAGNMDIIEELFRPGPTPDDSADTSAGSPNRADYNISLERGGSSYDRALRCAVGRQDVAVASYLWRHKAANWQPQGPSPSAVRVNMLDWVRRGMRDLLTATTRQGHLQLLQEMLDDTSVHPTVREVLDKEIIGDIMAAAASVGNAAVVRMLVGRYSAERYIRKDSMRVAAEGGNVDVLRILLEHGAQIEACAVDGEGVGEQYNELYKALVRGHADAARFLIAQGASLTKLDCGQEALCWSAAHKDEHTVRLIASLGVSVDLPAGDKLNPVVSAMSYSRDRTVEVLLELGAKPVDPKDSCHSHAAESGYWPFRLPLTETDHRAALW